VDWRAGSQGVPNAGNAHNRITLQVDFEWTLSLAIDLPFVKAAYGNDAALPRYQFSKQRAPKHRLALGIDG